MKPIEFPEQNTIYAEDQKEYLPLPAYRDRYGCVTSKWKLSWRERFTALFRGSVWVHVHTFNKPLVPVSLTVNSPFERL